MLPGTEIARRAVRHRRAQGRRHRAQLRDRSGRDDRAPSPPRRSTRACRSRASPTPACRRWSTARCTTTSRPSSSPTTTRGSSPSSACRSSAAAAARRPSTSARSSSGAATSRPAPRQPVHEPGAASIYSFTPFDQDITYLTIGERTNANGSKKFRDAMLDRRLGHVRADGQRAGEGRRARPRRVRRLRRPRRHRRHGRDRPPVRDTGDRPARARLHRAAGDGGRPAVARRPGHPQLRQPRGRRGARARGSTACSRWPASTAPPSSAC